MPWFTTKKVEGSATLSEKLKELRVANNTDLDALSDKTKISKKYLIYLEEGRLDKLPAEIYVKGFLKKLADFYSVDVKNFFNNYKKEESIRQNIDKSNNPPYNLHRSPTFVITPRTITFLIVGIALAAFLVFFGYQISSIFRGPELLIISPSDELVVDSTPVLVSGSVKDGDTSVFINGEAISLKDGRISEPVNLTPGLNVIKISAVSRFKKSSEVIRKVILKEKNGEKH